MHPEVFGMTTEARYSIRHHNKLPLRQRLGSRIYRACLRAESGVALRFPPQSIRLACRFRTGAEANALRLGLRWQSAAATPLLRGILDTSSNRRIQGITTVQKRASVGNHQVPPNQEIRWTVRLPPKVRSRSRCSRRLTGRLGPMRTITGSGQGRAGNSSIIA